MHRARSLGPRRVKRYLVAIARIPPVRASIVGDMVGGVRCFMAAERQTARVSKAKNLVSEPIAAAPRKPQLARAELLDKAARTRFEAEIDGALKRRPPHEAKLAGALRAIAPLSPALRGVVASALGVMLRRGSLKRELYAAGVRALAESADKALPALLVGALATEEAGGTATLSAACFTRDPSVAALLGKLAASRQSHLAFSAETARVVRGESNGANLASLAPKIKESHRIALCVELFVPLARSSVLAPRGIGAALAVLRSAERHLGRWLVLAEVAAKAGDPGPGLEAREKATVGPTSARAAWSLVAWALEDALGTGVAAPQTRPTVELVARLSDRPSADRDTTFLFRMARARAPSARPMLEGLVKGPPLADDVAVRAALYLARDHGRADLRGALLEAARTAKREDVRGLAAAALWDAGDHDRASEVCDELIASKSIGNVAWGALIRVAEARRRSGAEPAPLLVEAPLRWIQWGWLE